MWFLVIGIAFYFIAGYCLTTFKEIDGIHSGWKILCLVTCIGMGTLVFPFFIILSNDTREAMYKKGLKEGRAQKYTQVIKSDTFWIPKSPEKITINK